MLRFYRADFGYLLGLNFLLFFCLLLQSPLHADSSPNLSLGEIHFATSANATAQQHFIEGVLLLHSFEYAGARAAFQKAEKADPQFALAYWGEAMSYNYPLWNRQELDQAREALNKFAPTEDERVAKAAPNEKGLIHAVNMLFGSGTQKQRNLNYTNAMRDLYKANPNHDEIALFYALALLGLHEGAKSVPHSMQAAAIAEEVLQRAPKHPGALHYVIHSYDDASHAPLGLRAAQVYAKVARDAPHALHMPSHIFLALGMWDDVVASNEAALEASQKQHINDLHIMQWLIYGYLQKEQFDKAYPLVKKIESLAKQERFEFAKNHYALTRSAYLIESFDWKADLKPLDMSKMDLDSQSVDAYTNAVVALNTHQDTQEVAIYMQQLDNLVKRYPDALISKILALELRGQIQLKEGKPSEAITTLKQAAALEEELPFGEGPPMPPKPAHELLAEVLLQNQKYPEAYHAYMQALKRTPNRRLLRLGVEKIEETMKSQGQLLPSKLKPYFNKLMQQ